MKLITKLGIGSGVIASYFLYNSFKKRKVIAFTEVPAFDREIYKIAETCAIKLGTHVRLQWYDYRTWSESENQFLDAVDQLKVGEFVKFKELYEKMTVNKDLFGDVSSLLNDYDKEKFYDIVETKTL